MKRVILCVVVCLMFASICFSAPGVRKWQLRWAANTETDLAGYKLYYGFTSGVYGNPIDVGNVTNYLLTGVVPSNNYLALTAYDKYGNESGYSPELFFDKDQDAPAKPGGLKFTEVE